MQLIIKELKYNHQIKQNFNYDTNKKVSEAIFLMDWNF